MKAISTKYIGPTNFRGARVKASANDGDLKPPSITISWDHALNSEENHLAAAQALAWKMEWAGRWVGGSTVKGYVFVNVDRAEGFDVGKYENCKRIA